jgi:EAL domain-containing protein (putative c-di-GMP-specific phosphodiesterase class I)
MRKADLALYTAKHQRGGGYCVYHPRLSEHGRRRGLLESALRLALERGEFRLVYQPQIDAGTWTLCGFEALLRWRHPELGEISPTEFVPIAESIGIMPRLGQWVLEEACREAASWPSHLSVSVNVSAVQLRDPRFLASVLLATAPIAAPRIELEVTESALLDDITGAVATLHQLRRHGYRVALDDFGTGYSALSYLRRFPFDVLKIDRSFVRDLLADEEALVIVDTILAMSRALNMTTVAEGVESVEEAEMLRARGCKVLQGFLVSEPMHGRDVLSFATAWANRAVARRHLLAAG